MQDSPQSKITNPTLEHVARVAGVSKMTASRALNGRGYVAVATREKVRQAARTLGYLPNPLVQTLMAGVRRRHAPQRANLAWLTPHHAGDPQDASTSEVEQGARERAESLGYFLDVIHILPGNHTARGLARVFEARSIRGALIAPLKSTDHRLDLPWDQFAYATVGQSLPAPVLSYSMAHYPHNMRRVLSEIQSRGYRRIGMLHQRHIDDRSEHWAQMFFEHHCLQQGGNPRKLCVCYDGWEHGDYRRWAEANRLDAVVCDLPYAAAYFADEGLRIPEDLAFAAVSGKQTHPHITGVRMSNQALGAAAVDLLTAQIQRNERGIPARAKTILLEGDWIEGRTLPPSRS